MVVRYAAAASTMLLVAMMALTSIPSPNNNNNNPSSSILTRMLNVMNVGAAARRPTVLPMGIKGDHRGYGNDYVEGLMAPKAHGTCVQKPPTEFRFDVDEKVASKISCFNRKYAERAGSFASTNFIEKVKELSAEGTTPVKFFDTITGRHLFTVGGPNQRRTLDVFLEETKKHGWPSFRKPEVNWDHVRRTFYVLLLLYIDNSFYVCILCCIYVYTVNHNEE